MDNFQIFVINLERCPDKKLKMQQRLSGNNYEFIKAVDGKSLSVEKLETMGAKILEEWKDPYSGRNTTWGEVGCALSHYNIYEHCIKNNIENAVILEDDAIVPENFSNHISECLSDLRDVKDWNFLYLGRKSMDDNDIDYNEKFVKSGYSYWLCAYIINLQGMKKVVNSGFIKKIIPMDEIIPILGQVCPLKQYYQFFNLSEKLNMYSLKSLSCKPEPDAFLKSDTENSKEVDNKSDDLIILATGTDMTDGLKRFIKSCNVYGLKYKIMGFGKPWKGGNMAAGPGGGYKINLLRETLEEYHNNQIVLVTDSYDVIMSANSEEILSKYRRFETNIVFATESSCWPDSDKAELFPRPDARKNIFLNSGGFIGDVASIKKLVNDVPDDSDDQRWYIDIFLNKSHPMNSKIILDYNCQIFQCLNDGESEIRVHTGKSRVYNLNTKTLPCQIHGNGGPSRKRLLSRLGNYLMRNWNSTYGYNKKNEKQISEIAKNNKLSISIAFHSFDKIALPHIVRQSEINIEKCIKYIVKNGVGVCAHYLCKNDSLEEKVKKSIDNNSDFIWIIDPNYVVNNEKTLLHLIKQDRGIISPLLSKKGELWSNFWGDVTQDGWYKRSEDYLEICKRDSIGCWNVAHLIGNILINREYIQKLKGFFSNGPADYDECMKFSNNCRKNEIFMYCDNQLEFGYIFDMDKLDDVPKKAIHPEFYNFNSDRNKWAKRYLSKEFLEAFDNLENLKIEEPCKWCFQFPFVNDLFCEHLIDEVNALNAWSCGGEKSIRDERINNVEPVPTVDIHMKQIGFRKQWEDIVTTYIAKVISHVYSPYETKGLNIAFVVKYDMDGQKELKPHHDSSSYSVNIALNSPGLDFKGGGTRFIKQNVIVQNKKGYAIVHPGRLTHYHEGIPISEGTRYIMVSFVY